MLSKNTEFCADFRSEGLFQKKCARKKLDAKTVFPDDLGCFGRIEFWDYLFF